MWNEHFGIGIVEMMAAGLITIAHNSGGPKSDIVAPGTGFLATTANEYAQYIYEALTMDEESQEELRSRARLQASKFSDQVFKVSFLQAMSESSIL